MTALVDTAACAAAVVWIGAALWLGADADTVRDRSFEHVEFPPVLESRGPGRPQDDRLRLGEGRAERQTIEPPEARSRSRMPFPPS